MLGVKILTLELGMELFTTLITLVILFISDSVTNTFL
jgi:hypothetical protein